MQPKTLEEAFTNNIDCRFVPGHPAYMVDEHGNLYGRSGRRRSLKPDKRGYVRCVLTDGRGPRTLYLHRIVWEAFNGKTDGEVHHRDGDPANNSVINLATDSARSSGRPVVAFDEVEEIGFSSITAAAHTMAGKATAAANIHRALKRGSPAYGYHWRYAVTQH